MGNLFGKKKVSRVTEHDKAVLQVKQQRDKLKQYQIKIEQKLENERLLAKKLLTSGQRERAKLLLKKKRYQENLLEKTDGQLENLEKMIQDLEFAQVEVKVVAGLKIGSEALKSLNEILNIDEIERIMDDTREGIEKQKEIDDLLNGKLTEEDEEDVEKEYKELLKLEEEEISEKLPDIPVIEPELPATDLVEKEKYKEKLNDKPQRIALEA